MSFIWSVLATVGFATVAFKLLSIICTLYDTLIPRNPLPKYGASKPAKNWALVTGCTAGIGEEFTLQLAKAGFNVGLIGRNPGKLDKIASAVKGYNVEAATFVLDAANPSPQVYEYLEKWTKDLGSVSVLINNVGVSHSIPVPFAETTEEELLNIIKVNNIATLQVTKAVLPSLKAFTSANKSSRALVLTMGSFAGLTPSPLLATYSGSKAFLQAWNNSLASELKPLRIDAELIISYLVTSAMSKIRRSSATTPNPKQFVASAISCIGHRGGAQERSATMTPYWSHALIHVGVNQIGVYSSVVADFINKMHVSIRKRALKKKESAAATASTTTATSAK